MRPLLIDKAEVAASRVPGGTDRLKLNTGRQFSHPARHVSRPGLIGHFAVQSRRIAKTVAAELASSR